MRICEVHSGLSALLVDRSNYDGVWVSSLTHAAIHGLPDNELIPLMDRVDFVRDIKRFTEKPIIVDVDTLGGIEHVRFYVEAFRDAGAWAIVIEDKKYPKANSLLEKTDHVLEDVDIFRRKIEMARKYKDTMKVVARLESLIAKHSLSDALIRAKAYEEAGADMILIHSKQKIEATEVMEFSRKFREISSLPLIAIPTTYTLPDSHPFEIVIYANHLLRASMKAMENFIKGKEVELSTVEDIFDLVGH